MEETVETSKLKQKVETPATSDPPYRTIFQQLPVFLNIPNVYLTEPRPLLAGNLLSIPSFRRHKLYRPKRS
jgi:hypothetical protein